MTASSGSLFILTLKSMGEMSMVFPVTCLLSLFEAPNDAFEVQFFSGLHFYTMISQTIDSTQGHAAYIFYSGTKLLLNNAFNTWRPLGRGQDAESNLLNPHSFRNLSAYS